MMRAVLTFHSIDDSGTVLSFPRAAFGGLIERLAKTGTAVVPFGELLRRTDGVTISFDDGIRTVYEHALPVLRSHGFAAHVFVATGYVGKEITWATRGGATVSQPMLNWPQIEDCVRGGMRVECHTVTHADLSALAPEEAVEECSRADDEIERRVGRRPRLMAFPFGRYNERVTRALAPRYTACFTTRLGYLRRKQDLSRVPRLDSYYLQRPLWSESLFSARTRAYIALRASIRAVRRKT